MRIADDEEPAEREEGEQIQDSDWTLLINNFCLNWKA